MNNTAEITAKAQSRLDAETQEVVDALVTLTKTGILQWAGKGEWVPAEEPNRFNTNRFYGTFWDESSELDLNDEVILRLTPEQTQALKNALIFAAS